MQIAFWVWIGVIVASVIVEAVTMEMVSAWFAVGAVIPLILAGFNLVGWEIQLIIFIIISALLIIFLRKLALKFLFRRGDLKTNVDSLIGQKLRMLDRTDFETLGKVKINDVTWSAVGDKGQTIEKDTLVEVVEVSGNKLKVKEVQNQTSETKSAETKSEKKLNKKTETKTNEKS